MYKSGFLKEMQGLGFDADLHALDMKIKGTELRFVKTQAEGVEERQKLTKEENVVKKLEIKTRGIRARIDYIKACKELRKLEAELGDDEDEALDDEVFGDDEFKDPE